MGEEVIEVKQSQHLRKYKTGKVAVVNRGNIKNKIITINNFPFKNLIFEWKYYAVLRLKVGQL